MIVNTHARRYRARVTFATRSRSSVPARPADRPTLAYVVLLLLGALDAAGYSIIAPVTPVIAARTGVGPGTIGVLVAGFPLGILGGFVIAGVAIRRIPGRTLLLASLGLLGVGALGFALSDSIPSWLAARTLMGVGSAGLWIGITFATLARWPDQAYLCMSRIFAAYSVGGLVGPALGAIGGVAAPFAAYLALVAAGFALTIAAGPSPAATFTSDRTVLRRPGFRAASAAILFAVMALSLIEGILPLHLASGLSQAGIGLLYAAGSLVVAAAATVAARFEPRRLVAVATLLTVIGVGIIGFGADVVVWIAGLAIAGAGIGFANTGAIGLLLDGIPLDRSVTAIVLWSQLGIVGYLVGPLVGGAAVQAGGFGWTGPLVLLGALPVLALLARTRQSEPDAASAEGA